MKKITFLLFCAFALNTSFFACTSHNAKVNLEQDKTAVSTKKVPNEHTLDITGLMQKSGLQDFKLNHTGKKFQSVEAIYQNLDKGNYQAKELSFLQCRAAEIILFQFGILDSVDENEAKTRDFYIDVLGKTNLSSYANYLRVVRKIRVVWSPEKAASYKESILENAKQDEQRLEANKQEAERKLADNTVPEKNKKLTMVAFKMLQNALSALEELKKA